MKRTSGFTVIELISAVVLVIVVGTLVVLQKNNLDAANRDQERKTSVNAIYYGLKEGYLPQHNSYPVAVNKDILPYVAPSSFERIGDDPKYDLHYQGLDCEAANCKGFEIKINLEKEATYKKIVN
jgi:type II secretory pathway pseudopilin PulG